ncbi:MAG: VanZ family protein [Calditrichia bacterium]|nr:VanZ family protein [Calditrichia bacterium]
MKGFNLKNFIFFQIPWQFLMLAIFIQSSIGSLKLPYIEFDLADKILHFIVFGVLGILTARGLRNAKNKILKENYTSLTFLICIIYGALDETHQYFVPGRHASWGDWIADILGIVIMVWIYKRVMDSIELKNKKLGEDGAVI